MVALWPLLIPIIIFFVVFRLGPLLFRGIFRELDRNDIRRRFSRSATDVADPLGYRYPARDLESVIFQLANRLKGRITLSDVIIETGLGVKDAESFINNMVDGVRVRMEVDEERGFVIYEFPEIIERAEPD
jgi:hypothetical protein